MSSYREIIAALNHAADVGESTVLATVVQITGSSYGGVGSRMLVRVDGSTVGIVSGGCLESDLTQHARRVHESGKPEVVRYDTLVDDDAPWGLGLGCNGLIDVLLQPLSPGRAEIVASLLTEAIHAPEASLIATVIHVIEPEEGWPELGAHALLSDDRMETLGDWGNGFTLADVESKKVEAFAAGRRGLVHDFGGVEIAFEVVHPAVHIIACGSGPDVLPLTTLALQLGWEVTVVDHRPLVESHVARFPGANVIHCAEPIRLAELVPMSSRTAGVVMSHHFSRDTDYLNAFLSADPGYIGVLGPRPRTERMIAELAARGAKVRRDIGDKLFAPIGLDVGGEGPHAIALAIVSEITAVMNLRPAGYLRDRSGPLHPPRIPTPPNASPVTSES